MNQPVTTSSDISYASQAAMRHWDEVKGTVMGRLHLAAAYLARIHVGDWSDRREKMDWLKGYIGPTIREANPAEVLGDSHLVGMVRELFGEKGVTRLRDKAHGRT